jgi:hypothetical protein
VLVLRATTLNVAVRLSQKESPATPPKLHLSVHAYLVTKVMELLAPQHARPAMMELNLNMGSHFKPLVLAHLA